MKLDAIDKFIISEIFSAYECKKDITTWQIAKKMAEVKEEAYHISSLDKHRLTLMCNKIKRRLDSIAKSGYIFKVKNGNAEDKYLLNLDFVIVAKHKFKDGLKKAIIFKI